MGKDDEKKKDKKVGKSDQGPNHRPIETVTKHSYEGEDDYRGNAIKNNERAYKGAD